MSLDLTATAVFVALFLFVTWLGFVAARWRKADLNILHEWGLGGRRFGTVVTWFLLGGDLYTAYTFIAVPALVFGAGAMGFFAVPYTILIYPILYLVFPRLWAIAHARGHVTAADFVRDRFGNRLLALAVALTGIIATMPYIALQLVGMEVVIGALGFPAGGFVGHLPLIIAFIVLAAFTYTSGLRAPALIAVVKDMLIFVTIFAAVVIIPAKLGGYGAIFASVPQEKLILAAPNRRQSRLSTAPMPRLALGSALALFLYPHAMTGILSASSGDVIRRNAALLAAYSFILGLIALLGYMAIAAGVVTTRPMPLASPNMGRTSPCRRCSSPPSRPGSWAWPLPAIAIGALVPAAIMSIACANLFTRNLYKELLAPELQRGGRSQHGQDRVARGEDRGGRVHPRHSPGLRHPAPASRRHLDHPASTGHPARPLHAVLQRHGLVDRVGCRPRASAPTWRRPQGFASSVYPLSAFGLTIPGYAALYSVIVNFAFPSGSRRFSIAACNQLTDRRLIAARGVPFACAYAPEIGAFRGTDPRPRGENSVGSAPSGPTTLERENN